MLFGRFLKKRQQDADKKEDRGMLAKRAREADDPAVRRDAARRLDDLSELRRIFTEDPDAGVREIAAARYRHLLCGPQDREGSLEACLAELPELRDPRVIEQVATAGSAPEIRRAAIERVRSPEVLALCALQDPLAGNRAAAIERLEDKAALEHVLHQIGKKDKRVHRAAREKLRRIAEQAQRPLRVRELCDELCQKAERLGRLGQWQQDRALLDHIDRQWSEIRDVAEPAWQSRFEGARERFLQAYAQHDRAAAARIVEEAAQDALSAERSALLEALSEAAALATEDEVRALCARVSAAWDALEPLAPERQRPFDQRYRELMGSAEAALTALGEQRMRLTRLQRSTRKARKLLEESKPLPLASVKAFVEQGRALSAELAGRSDTSELAAFLDRVEVRIKTQHKHAVQRLERLPDKLADLERHLASGELKKADPLFQSLRAGLELVEASGLRQGAAEEIVGRLHALAPRLRDLQNWRRWGADQHREGLCEEMERLVDAELPLEVLSERLRGLHKDWKALEKTGPQANQALWERFQRASESVQGRCRPFLEAQAAQREANRAARESVCDQLERFLAQVDWERVDWKRVLRAERETRQAWAAIGPVQPRDRKALEGRFRHALRQLDQRLDGERKRNQTLKHELIRKIEALAEEPDLDAAIERTKSLQREWHTTVPARHKEENRLWQTFRAASDRVFERRAALHQAQVHELEGNLAAREGICAEASALAESEEDPQRLADGLHHLEQRWDDARSLPVPRQAASQLNQRWRDARSALRQRWRAREDGARREALDLLRRQAELCERLELGLLGEGAEHLSPEAALNAWQALPEQRDSETQQAIAGRFSSALAAAGDPAQLESLRQRYQANAARLGQLCLQLEILAGVETPPELAQERLEFQVARLTERMVEGEEDPLQGSQRLLKEWYLSGPAPRTAGLGMRFERIRRALSGETAEDEAAAC